MVNIQAFTDKWDLYAPASAQHKQPPTAMISVALSGLSLGRKQCRIHGKQVWFAEIDTNNLIAWAEAQGFSSEEEITVALQRNTPMKRNLASVEAAHSARDARRKLGD